MNLDLKPRNPMFFLYSVGISGLILIADYFSGPFIQFPITYLIPVAFTAWYNGRGWGLVFAFLLPLVRLYYNAALWSAPWSISDATINALIRIIVFSSFAVILDRTARQTIELSKQVSMLEGLLPICSYCKKIRDRNDEWESLEKYIMDRSTAKFSHGICPDCFQKHFGELLSRKK